METNNFGDAIFYRASCSCSDKQCDLELELELDKEINMINLNIYEDLYYSSYWKTDNWFADKWYRIKASLRLLFTGEIKVEGSFMFEGEEHINDFLKTLKQGMAQLKTERAKKNEDIS